MLRCTARRLHIGCDHHSTATASELILTIARSSVRSRLRKSLTFGSVQARARDHRAMPPCWCGATGPSSERNRGERADESKDLRRRIGTMTSCGLWQREHGAVAVGWPVCSGFHGLCLSRLARNVVLTIDPVDSSACKNSPSRVQSSKMVPWSTLK